MCHFNHICKICIIDLQRILPMYLEKRNNLFNFEKCSALVLYILISFEIDSTLLNTEKRNQNLSRYISLNTKLMSLNFDRDIDLFVIFNFDVDGFLN